MKPLSRSFFKKPTIEVAKSLLGCHLIHETPEGKTSGIIVETEAYLHDDPASHTFNGKTPRNTVMFGPPGKAYIYFTYGMYYCFNVSTNKEGIGEGVLIRALEPLEGIDLMKKRRKTDKIKQLCSGPAKLVIAMGIKKTYLGHDLSNPPLQILHSAGKKDFKIIKTERIGISTGRDLPHRFYIKGNEFISKK